MQVAVNIDIESPEPFHITEEMRRKAKELRYGIRFCLLWKTWMLYTFFSQQKNKVNHYAILFHSRTILNLELFSPKVS